MSECMSTPLAEWLTTMQENQVELLPGSGHKWHALFSSSPSSATPSSSNLRPVCTAEDAASAGGLLHQGWPAGESLLEKLGTDQQVKDQLIS